MEQGWIWLYRRLKDKGFYKKSAYVHLWVHILLSVNHEPKEFFWNGSTIIVRPGQFVTGRDSLSEATGIHRSMIERILDFFEKDRQIEQQKTSKYRLITVLNWRAMQNVSNKRATAEQPVSTNKNEKNEKNNTGLSTKNEERELEREIRGSVPLSDIVARYKFNPPTK